MSSIVAREVAEPLQIAIVEDEDLFRQLLVHALSGHPRLNVVGSFKSGAHLLEASERLQIDVCLMDINLGPGTNGVATGLQLRKRSPQTAIVLLSNYDEPGILLAIPSDDVMGWSYLLKKSVSHLGMVVRAVEGAASGLVVLDPSLVKAFKPRPEGILSRITPRQLDVLQLIAKGYSNRAIAEELVITEKSVENQVSLLYQNLGIESQENHIHARVKATLLFLDEQENGQRVKVR